MIDLDIVVSTPIELEIDVQDPVEIDLTDGPQVYLTPAENTYINRRIYIQATEPSNPILGDLWIDIS